MANEKRYAFHDSAGNILECSMCDPDFLSEWKRIKGFKGHLEMDHVDGKARMIEPGDAFDNATRSITKGGGKIALAAFEAGAKPV